jgi:Uma2 family endonuclease
MPLVIELSADEEQTASNVRRWSELVHDQELARWPGRLETDRHGQIIMSPPAAAEHGDTQSEIVYLLRTLLPAGRPLTECPISTPDGVKVADVAWLSAQRKPEIRAAVCLTRAPEICIEVLSPDNTHRQMNEKKALYFAAGAVEVWFCDRRRQMRFFPAPDSAGEDRSRICPAFPPQLES